MEKDCAWTTRVGRKLAMYKYRYNNKIGSASGFSEARKRAGLALPEGIDPISHFIVRIWQWNEDDDDFSIEILDTPGHQVFQDYDDALTCFRVLATQYPAEVAQEIKLELIHFHRGRVTIYHSKILFPPLLAGQM